MSGPIIEEIGDDMKQLEIAPSEQRKLKSALKELDATVSGTIRNLQNNKLTAKQSGLLMAAINAKRFISSDNADKFIDDFQKQLIKIPPEEQAGFLIVYDALASMRNEVLSLQSAQRHELQLAAYKAGKNPLAVDEMKVSAYLETKAQLQNIALAGGAASLVTYGLHKTTSSISILAEGLKHAGDYLSNYQFCTASSDASWLSYENLVCGVANKVLEPVAKASGNLTSSIGIISSDLREGGVLMLGIILFLALLVFVIVVRKISSTKKLGIAFLGGVEFKFSGGKKVRKSARKKFGFSKSSKNKKTKK